MSAQSRPKSVKCAVCGESLDAFTIIERQMHVNVCIDKNAVVIDDDDDEFTAIETVRCSIRLE